VTPQDGDPPKAALEFPEHLAREFEVLAQRWTFQILLLLLQRPIRFNELSRAVGTNNNTMGRRLQELQAAGLVNRHVDPGPPITVSYTLTADGEALRPILELLQSWAERRADKRRAKPR
jgi:DNA-binding HxlR family transcriptional regulator